MLVSREPICSKFTDMSTQFITNSFVLLLNKFVTQNQTFIYSTLIFQQVHYGNVKI